MKNLSPILNFLKLTHRLQSVTRTILVDNMTRQENDAEHSYQLAMTAWYIISFSKLRLNKDKVIKYALVHDMVEAYAGDTYFHSKNKKHISNKNAREKKALLKLEKDFSDFPDLTQLIHEYESRKSKEVKFVYALDKILPILNIYLNDGKEWKLHEVTQEMLIANKKDKVSLDPFVQECFNEIIKLLNKHRKNLFGK